MYRTWKPARIDIALFPIWIVFEVTCFFATLPLALIVVFMIYQGAKDFRDWWHAGARNCRR